MSEKPEGAMKNGQSRETVNTGHIRHRMKTNNNKNTTQKTKKMNNIDPTKNRGCTQERIMSYLRYLRIVAMVSNTY
jgi:hypothetical protein